MFWIIIVQKKKIVIVVLALTGNTLLSQAVLAHYVENRRGGSKSLKLREE